jgi:hypothetical protein
VTAEVAIMNQHALVFAADSANMAKRDYPDIYQDHPARQSADSRLRPDMYDKKPNELASYERLLRELERRPIEERKGAIEG